MAMLKARLWRIWSTFMRIWKCMLDQCTAGGPSCNSAASFGFFWLVKAARLLFTVSWYYMYLNKPDISTDPSPYWRVGIRNLKSWDVRHPLVCYFIFVSSDPGCSLSSSSRLTPHLWLDEIKGGTPSKFVRTEVAFTFKTDPETLPSSANLQP